MKKIFSASFAAARLSLCLSLTGPGLLTAPGLLTGPSLLTGLCILFSGCGPKQVSKEKLIRLIDQDKALAQTRDVNGIEVGAKYVPYQLMVLQELEGSGKRDSGTLNGLEKKYRSQYYFRITFSKDKKEVIRQLGSFHRYSDMLQVMSFELGSHINASTEAGDTLYLKDYAFDQDYGMSSANASLLVFAKDDFTKAREIQLNIGEFGLGIGDLKFVFSKEDINRLPKLVYPRLE